MGLFEPKEKKRKLDEEVEEEDSEEESEDDSEEESEEEDEDENLVYSDSKRTVQFNWGDVESGEDTLDILEQLLSEGYAFWFAQGDYVYFIKEES